MFNTLENETGFGKFKYMFTIITFDSGVEFADGANIVASKLTHGNRFAIYYVHSLYHHILNLRRSLYE